MLIKRIGLLSCFKSTWLSLAPEAGEQLRGDPSISPSLGGGGGGGGVFCGSLSDRREDSKLHLPALGVSYRVKFPSLSPLGTSEEGETQASFSRIRGRNSEEEKFKSFCLMRNDVRGKGKKALLIKVGTQEGDPFTSAESAL